MKRVIIAMSGGVDSSVAAHLLKEQGYEVIGLFMSLGPCLEKQAPRRKACCSIFDANDARAVAEKLRIDFTVLDFQSEFERIIQYFCDEYDCGRTPNPCIRCNQYLKFGRLWETGRKLGADYLATGHYARIIRVPQLTGQSRPEAGEIGRYLLKKGLDATKDQSYMLFTLSQEQLAHVIFPLGEYTKPQVRALARQINLPVQDKPDSQETCFVPSTGLDRFLKKRLAGRIVPGEIRDRNGKVLGRHAGYQLYTIGQRHLGVALGRPFYVVKIIPGTNTIVVGEKKDVYHRTFVVDEVNWIRVPQLTGQPRHPVSGETGRIEASVKIRYLHPPAPARIVSLPNNELQITFAEPQPSITPGQATVFYQDDVVLGGGWIKSVETD